MQEDGWMDEKCFMIDFVFHDFVIFTKGLMANLWKHIVSGVTICMNYE